MTFGAEALGCLLICLLIVAVVCPALGGVCGVGIIRGCFGLVNFTSDVLVAANGMVALTVSDLYV